jgi:FMN phosphatase YigB (HAD superfamily)
MLPAPPVPTDLAAVFFDIGGTLVGPNLRLLGAWLRQAGVDCDDDHVARIEPFARRAQAERRHAYVGTPRLRGLYVEELIGRIWEDAASDPARLTAAVDRVLATGLAAGYIAVPVWNEVLPGVAEGLAALRASGLRLVAVSNSDGSAEAVLADAGIREPFDAVIDSHHVGFSKPDPRIFDAACAAVGVDARQVVHVGDLYEADVVGAQAAGIAAILIDGCGFWPDAPCLRADSPDAAIRMITAVAGRGAAGSGEAGSGTAGSGTAGSGAAGPADTPPAR